MAAEPNPYFEPYLRSATPTQQFNGNYETPYPSYGQPQYPPQPPYTPGSSAYNLHPQGFPTPNEGGPLLNQQAQHPYGAYVGHRPNTPSAGSIRLDPIPGGPNIGPLWSEKGVTPTTQSRTKRKRIIAIICGVIILIIIIAVVVAVTRKKGGSSDEDESGESGQQNGGKGNGGKGGVLLAGGDGSTITMDDGTEFQYKNAFGGNWLWDAADPFNGGKANEWTPAINESWTWGKDQIRGVNLGGWLVLEPFISPAIFEKYSSAHVTDEYTLHTALKADQSPDGGVKLLEQHYQTFITERDFAEIAGAGLNWVRIPIAFWAIETWPEEEPFIGQVSWQYFLKAIQWARKYGLRINLDLHAVPGSQNGWNHSGRLLRSGNWLKTVMGIANAQRTLSYIRVLTQFISQPQYSNVIPMFGIVNEPYTVGTSVVADFYLEAYNMIRSITGIGKGPVISLFDERPTLPLFASSKFLDGADRIALDIHPYFAFGEAVQATPESFVPGACSSYSPGVNRTWNNFGIISAGEWSLGINDCGKWVAQTLVTKYDTKFGAGACKVWDDYENWTPEVVAGMTQLWRAQADALGDWFFWTWKIGPSMLTNKIEAPFWSYQLGLERGWIPKDPRSAVGACAEAGTPETIPRPQPEAMPPYRVGSATAAAPTDTARFPWPPTALVDQRDAAALPQYTPTGTIVTLPGPTFTDPANPQKTLDAGTGWFNSQDTAGMYVPIQGCTYPDAWSAAGVPVPTKCP